MNPQARSPEFTFTLTTANYVKKLVIISNGFYNVSTTVVVESCGRQGSVMEQLLAAMAMNNHVVVTISSSVYCCCCCCGGKGSSPAPVGKQTTHGW